MKRILSVGMMLLMVSGFCGCVSQNDYDKLNDRVDKINAEFQAKFQVLEKKVEDLEKRVSIIENKVIKG